MFVSSQGEQGERGSPGAAGSSGPDGPTGPRGDKGEPGLPGETVSNIYNTLWVECESLFYLIMPLINILKEKCTLYENMWMSKKAKTLTSIVTHSFA